MFIVVPSLNSTRLNIVAGFSSLIGFFVVQFFFFLRTVCGYLRNLDVFIVVPFLNSTKLKIVAEADLRCGSFFLSETNCRYKLVVSTSFWSWLLNVSSNLTTKKTHNDNFFWVVNVLMCCGYADTSWEYQVFDFGHYVSVV